MPSRSARISRGEWARGAPTTRRRFQHGNWATDQRTGHRPGPRAAPGRRLESDVIAQVVASCGHGCYHASYASSFGFASINASTADSSQLAASDADGVRSDLGRSAPVRSSGGSCGGRQPARTPPTDRAAVASTCSSCLPGRQGNWGLGITLTCLQLLSPPAAASFLKTDEQAWPPGTAIRHALARESTIWAALCEVSSRIMCRNSPSIICRKPLAATG